MKVVILCGGKGMRLREETEYRPKPLVCIGDRPILWHIMNIYSHYGFRDFILCLGYKGDMIKDYFLNYDEMNNDFTLQLGAKTKSVVFHDKDPIDNWRITFADTGLHTNTGGRIARIQKYLQDDEHFFLTYGDGVADIDINDLYAHHVKMGLLATLSGVRPLTPFGVIEPVKGRVRHFAEKPKERGYISGGFFVCSQGIFDFVKEDESCTWEREPLQTLASKGQLAVYEHSGFWHCLDTMKHLEDLNEMHRVGNRPWAVWE